MIFRRPSAGGAIGPWLAPLAVSLGAPALAAPQQVEFLPAQAVAGAPLPTIQQSRVVDATDDGIPDLVAVGQFPGGSSALFLAEGLGARAFAPLVEIAGTEGATASPQAGDLDGDGDQDIAVAGPAGEVIVVQRDAGAFHVLRLTGLDAQSVAAVADSNADGALDLYVRTSNDTVRIGTLSIALDLDQLQSTQVPAMGVTVADLNGDGRAELVSADTTLQVWPGALNGTGAPIPLSSGSSGAFQDSGPRVQIVDLNGDGHLDVVPGAFPLDSRFAYLGDGSLNFTQAPLLGAQTVNLLSRDARLIHANADGVLDLVYFGPATNGDPFDFRTFLSLGTGALPFAPGVSTELFEAPTAANPIESFVDLDADGADDLVVGGSVRYGPFDGAPPAFGPPVSVLDISLFEGPVSLPKALDVNGDGLLDAVTWAGFANRVEWRPGIGDRAYGPPADLFPGRLIGPNPFAAGENTVAVVARSGGAPLDELVVVRVPADPPVPIGVPTTANGVIALVDLNGDGSEDVLTDRGYHPVDANGVPGPLVGIDGLFSQIRTADMDGDGDLDIVRIGGIGTSDPNGTRVVFVLRNQGAVAPISAPIPIASVRGSVALTDLDLDGRIDIVTRTADALEYRRGRGALTYDPPVAVAGGLPAGDFTAGIDAVDVDQDGDPDLALYSFFPAVGEDLVLWVHPGDLTGPTTFVSVVRDTPVSAASTFADLDRDGDLDALLGTQAGRVVSVENAFVPRSGVPFCEQLAPNSTGGFAALSVYGQPLAGGDPLLLQATGLPPQAFGIFVGSPTTTPGTPLANSAGLLCLGQGIGRYARPEEILSSTGSGLFELRIATDDLRTGGGSVAATAGLSWSFQGWYRDVLPGGVNSHLTPGITVTF